MASGFAPEFLILIGVDIFLGASILTVLLDKHFPTALPYILDVGAMIGFGELLTGPSTVNSLSTELQFYYSFTYAMISVLALFALNLYLLFLRRRPFESAMLGVFATVPAGLGILYFTSAFVNGLTISLPLIPEIPIEGVYIMFGLSVGLIVFSLVVFGKKLSEPTPQAETEREPPLEEPIPAQASGASGHVLAELGSEKSATGVQPESQVTPDGSSPAASSTQIIPGDRSASGSREARLRGTEIGEDVSGGRLDLTRVSADAGSSSNDMKQQTVQLDRPGLSSASSILVEKKDRAAYKKRLMESMKFLEKAVDHPVRIDPSSISGTFKDVSRAYLTRAGMIIAEDTSGRAISVSLLDLPTDEALKVMTDAMKVLEGGGGGKR
ncbi:MAG: hypothetical protein KGI38_10890 [Thaumarchaeota archaeon]|nr:hypothetical protein [Nitrososphaerota archaeon]